MRLKNNVSPTKQYIYSVSVPIIIVLICYPLREYINAPSVAFLLLLALTVLGMFADIIPVILMAFISANIWNFLFLKPQFHFRIDNADDAVLLSSFFIVALLNGVLTHKIRIAERVIIEKEEKENEIKLYDTIFSSLSHELRTPVTTIMGCADSLLKRDATMPNADRKILLNEISTASARLSQQINNLLDMSRLQSGMLKPRKEWCEIKDLIDEVVNDLKYKSRGHHLVLNVQEDMPLVSLDYGLIQQVLINLLNNAILYTPKNSTIEINSFIDNEHLIIQVADSGKGIPDTEKEKAFDKFFRGSGTVSGGTGLGLSIVKGYVEAHGGKIYLEKSDMGGAKFIINIPVSLTQLYETDK